MTGRRERKHAILKVCHLIDHTEIAGAQRLLLDLIEARGEHIDPTVISLRAERSRGIATQLQAAGASVRSVRLDRLGPIALWRLRKALPSFDVLHTHLDYASTIGVACALTLGSKRPAIVTHVHNDPARHNGAAYRFVTAHMASRVDAHSVPARSLIEPTRSALGRRAPRVELIEHAIDLKRFDRGRYAAEIGQPFRRGAKRVVGFIGRLVPQKRADVLLAAVPHLLEADPATRVLVAGTGPLEAELRAQCRRLGIEESVDFFDPDDVVPIYLAMDVFCLPSDYEGFGLVLAEAMALEVPVVATDVTGSRDIAIGGETAVVVHPGDPEAVAAGILRVLDDPDLRESLTATALERVRARYSRDLMASRLEALYQDLVRSRTENRPD